METEGVSKCDKVTEKQTTATVKKGVVCDPKKWRAFIYIVTMLYVLWYNMLEYFSVLLDRYDVAWCKQGDVQVAEPINTVGEMTPVARSNSLSRRDSREALLAWLENESFEGTKCHEYGSYGKMLTAIVRSCARGAYVYFLTSLVLRNEDISEPLAKLSKTFESIRRKTEKTVKFRFLFKTLVSFLRDVERGKVDDMIQMIHFISEDIASRPCTWWLEFEHSFFRSGTVSCNVYETAMAMISYFFDSGANFDQHGLARIRDSPRKMHDCMLTLFMISGMERIGNSWKTEINVTEFGGTERLLVSDWKEGFACSESAKTKVTDGEYKDKVIWDVMLNTCSEYVESSWSTEILQRGLWGLQTGRQFVKRSDFDKLMKLKETEDTVDLTEFDSRVLLSFVICGVMCFHGNENDAIFRMLEVVDGPDEIHGALPAITIQDLVDVGVMGQVGKDRFMMKDLPGNNRKYKGQEVDGRISFTTHKYNTQFSARATQSVF